MRRAFGLTATVTLLLFSAPSFARPWHGLTPSVSTKAEVVKKFGSPTRELPLTVRYASGLVYQAKEAQEFGAEEAQFFFDNAGKLTEIFVFPQVALKRDDIIKAYGASYEERRTDDFRLYFQYKTDGFVVFFDKDNESVYQLQFTPSTAAAVVAATPPPVAPAATPPAKTATANPPAVAATPAPK